MSRLAAAFSLGLIRRSPIDSAEAKALYARHPEHEGQLVLLESNRVTFGRRVFAAVPRVVMTAPFWLLGMAAVSRKARSR